MKKILLFALICTLVMSLTACGGSSGDKGASSDESGRTAESETQTETKAETSAETKATVKEVKLGDYVQMGTYYGEPILWRCVDVDENGPLMLSDKIICLKPFDAITNENGTTGSHSNGRSIRVKYGSNYWADSNMRSWLNSDADAGNVEWLCGNPPSEGYIWERYNEYDQETGFLHNFTQDEIKLIKEVTQKSLLAEADKELNTNSKATDYHGLNFDIDEVIQDYDTAYSEEVTDKMFLLDVKQVNAVYNNRDVLGEDYYIGEPTAKAVSNSEYTYELEIGKKWHYWLRSPGANSSYDVRFIVAEGGVGVNAAYYGFSGVRPAFYLDTASFSAGSGAGTESDPYTVK